MRIFFAFIAAISIIFISNFSLDGKGFDISQDKLFTLDKSTKEIITSSKNPVEIDFFFSKQASTQNPQIRQYGNRVRDILRQFASASNGKIILKEIDVNQFSAQEDAAIALGLLPYNDIGASLEPIYLGAAFKSGNKISKIPYFDPLTSDNLEYEIAKSIINLQKEKQKTIGIISGQDWFIENNPNGAPRPIAQIAKSIAEENILINLSQDFAILPPHLDLIMIVQPWALSDIQQNLLSQYVKNGGRAIVCLDPYSNISADNGLGNKNYIQNLGLLEKEWGIVFSNEVLMDKKGALPVRADINGRPNVMPLPLFFNVPSQNFDKTTPLLAGLKKGINFASPSYLNPPGARNFQYIPILVSSNDNMRIESQKVSQYENPQEAANLWEGEDKQKTIAALITPQQNNKNGEILVIADSDFLADSLYSDDNSQIADNKNFILNSIDYLSGDQGLMQLRSKQKIKRNFTKIDDLKNAAQTQILEKQGVLNQELQTINQQIRELSSLGNNPEIQNQLNLLRQNALEKRDELKKLNENIAKSIDKVKLILIAICGIFVPLMLFFIWGMFYNKRQKIGLMTNGKF